MNYGKQNFLQFEFLGESKNKGQSDKQKQHFISKKNYFM